MRKAPSLTSPQRFAAVSVLLLLLLLSAGGVAPSYGQTTPALSKDLDVFLEKHCFECHDDASSKADLNLLDLEFDPGDEAAFSTWVHVFDRVRAGEMPPEKKPRPAGGELAKFLEALEKPLLAADRKDIAENGRVQVRRLTRLEYENTILDLLGIDLPLQEHLPEDPASHGFETVASGQQLSHHNLARYLETADLALTSAFERALKGDRPFARSFKPNQLGKAGHRGGNYRGPDTRDGLSISWPIRLQFYGRMPATRVPEDGWYRVTLKDLHAINPKGGVVWGTLRSGTGASNAPMLYYIGHVEATAAKRDVSYEAWIRRGHLLELKPADATLKTVPTGARGGNVSYQGRDLRKQGVPGIAISGIEMARIYPNGERWEVRTRLFGGISKEEAARLKSPSPERDALVARTIRQFANRAFRRPVSAEQARPYVDLALDALKEPDARPADAMKVAYRAILCSPRFLTFTEKPGRLDEHALASRISYMLWNSMPDKELRNRADQGQLSQPQVLHSQVERMLDDPRSARFVASFTDQWLNLREIDFTSPDRRLFRTFDEIVKVSMVEETRAFVGEMIGKDLPIRNLIHSDFAMVNERLARFYGMGKLPVERGGGLQKVALGEYRRGGLITQGAILKVTANGTTTSPVVRGVWVNERILGMEIPPPPANVPAVEPDIRGAVSIRDQLDKHRNDELCSSCHEKIDPAGFALESFDPVGLWRQKYGSHKNAARVNPAGVTPDGEKFANIAEWKKIYHQKPELLSSGFARQLLTYATGAPIRFSDREAVSKIVAKARGKNYGIRTILHGVVASEPFQHK